MGDHLSLELVETALHRLKSAKSLHCQKQSKPGRGLSHHGNQWRRSCSRINDVIDVHRCNHHHGSLVTMRTSRAAASFCTKLPLRFLRSSSTQNKLCECHVQQKMGSWKETAPKSARTRSETKNKNPSASSPIKKRATFPLPHRAVPDTIAALPDWPKN